VEETGVALLSGLRSGSLRGIQTQQRIARGGAKLDRPHLFVARLEPDRAGVKVGLPA